MYKLSAKAVSPSTPGATLVVKGAPDTKAATTTTTTCHTTSSYNYVNFFIDLGELDICTTHVIAFIK
jgi:hypothetical protein